ncbi:SbcC/MukB-like Walker B domain-containing protein [Cryobacterium sp. Sr3]|uniref:ATP-binding protein n=1 Tax=Cryobacterium sp. Sr3 TaxID=1259194 RepID=UPI00106A6B3C|nr:SbcC/MukB-like Walker B domain-containing protein [Cryobacterium sp. Sr3]TFB60592.1 hypothetical protein E3N94_01885 [Cryobacterium sp. Sr3]
MNDSPLFYVDGLTEGTTQWRAESFQMVNWGGFQGHHEVAFAPSATLVSGASGTGKSSLLDAYLALMMPSDTPFNGASNDAGSGRARSADQRSLMTYLKGKTDANREAGTGELQDQVLRGAHESTWGAVSMTFIDDNQRRFTVLRAYFVPRGATRFADITMKMATIDGYLDLRDLADVTESRFDKRALKSRFPELDVFDTYAAFAQTLYTRLGIGANGEGGKALRLLARIQAGQQVKTVDGLYKSMVLEEPSTYGAADKAVAHFEDLERSYGAMVAEAQKAKVLERLPVLHRVYETATDKADLIDTFGVHRSGDTPFVLWQLRTEQSLLEEAADVNRVQRRDTQLRSTTARDAETALKARVADLQRQQRDNGGDVLVSLQNELGQLTDKRDDVAAERSKFDERIRPLGLSIDSGDDFDRARAAADGFLSGFPTAEIDLENKRSALQRTAYPVEENLRTLGQEHQFLSGRASLVPQHLHSARLLIAEASGIPAEELARLRLEADSLAREAFAHGASLADLRARRGAHQFVVDAAWPAIDVQAADVRITDKRAERERVLADSDVLRALKDEEERLAAELETAQKLKHATEVALQALVAEQGRFVDRQDAVSSRLDRIDGDPEAALSLSEEHATHLDAQFAAVADQHDLDAFDGAIRRLRERLTEQSSQDRDSAAGARNTLIGIFETFQSRWPDPNIGVSLDSYPSYRDILDAVYTLGLHDRRQEWKRRLALWSGQDLVPLVGAFTSSIEEIEDRLRPINEILTTLPFGAGRDRLKIALRRLHRDDATAFRTELKVLSSGSTDAFTDEQTESRFTRLQAFMNLIRKSADGPRQESQRDLLLDVRRHVEITAVRTTPEGVEVSTYSSLGGKSGGESQELVAFVVGAALRFQLGDESRTRPRFAPVFLDEGFVKSDSEFAGRAVSAWKGLGFQLIIGSPLDKVTALEPHMELVLSMTKNNSTGFSYITPLSSPVRSH